MHGTSLSIEELLRGLLQDPDLHAESGGPEMAVFPPSLYLPLVRDLASGSTLTWGAQDVSEYDQGAYTGEIAAEMLTDQDCTYVLVGHSERRTLFGDTNERVAEKFSAAQSVGLLPVLCVGETLEQRQADETEAVVGAQLDAVLQRDGIAAFENAVVAYEPVWAIGTGETASPEQAQEIHAFIRGKLSAEDDRIGGQLRILYGGSMKAANAADLLAMEDIDGGLVGGASLQAEAFLGIFGAAKALVG